MSHDTRKALPGSGTTPAGRTSRPGSQIMLAVVLIGELMAVLDASVVDTALPTIQADTGASAAGLQWTHAAYALALGIGLITGGRLGDLYGRKRTFLLGTGAFTGASLLCTLAVGPATLIAARAVQGAGAAVMIPQVLATLHVTFSDSDSDSSGDSDNDRHSGSGNGSDRSKAFGLYGTVLSIGSAAGPLLGGVLTQADLFGPVRAATR